MPLREEAPLPTSPPCHWRQPRVGTHRLEGSGLPSRTCMPPAGRLPAMSRSMIQTSSGTFPMSSRNGQGPSQRTIAFTTTPRLPSHAVQHPLIHPLPSHQVSGHWMLIVAQHMSRPTEAQRPRHTLPNQQLLPLPIANRESSRSKDLTHATQAYCSNPSLGRSPRSNWRPK